MLFFTSCFQLNLPDHQGDGCPSADLQKRQQAVVDLSIYFVEGQKTKG